MIPIQAVTWPLSPKKLRVTFSNLWKAHVNSPPQKGHNRRLARILGSWQFYLPVPLLLVPQMDIKSCLRQGNLSFFLGVLSDSWWFSGMLGFEYPICDEVFTVTSAILGLGLESLLFSRSSSCLLLTAKNDPSRQNLSIGVLVGHWALPFDRRNPPKTSWKKSSLSRIFAGFYVLSLATKIWTIHSTIQGIQVSLNLAQPETGSRFW